MITLTSTFGTGDLLWSVLWFFLFVIWIWLLIAAFADIFRSQDLSGWGKALWTVFVIVLPYLGVFGYLIARGHKMSEHTVQAAQAQDAATRGNIQSVAGSFQTVADEIARLADLRGQGVISDDEFGPWQGEAVVVKLVGTPQREVGAGREQAHDETIHVSALPCAPTYQAARPAANRLAPGTTDPT